MYIADFSKLIFGQRHTCYVEYEVLMEYFVCRKWCARNITHIIDDHAAHSKVIKTIS
jgi:hypothetical protein